MWPASRKVAVTPGAIDDRLPVRMTDEALHRPLRVGDVVERLEDRPSRPPADPPRIAVFVVESGLDRPSVRRDARQPLGPLRRSSAWLAWILPLSSRIEPRQLDGRWRGVDRPGEARPDEDRDEPAVVEMGVREQERVDRGRVVGEVEPVALAVARRALEHAAVHEHPGAVGREQELRARDRGRGAQEGQLHGAGSGLRARRQAVACRVAGIRRRPRLVRARRRRPSAVA